MILTATVDVDVDVDVDVEDEGEDEDEDEDLDEDEDVDEDEDEDEEEEEDEDVDVDVEVHVDSAGAREGGRSVTELEMLKKNKNPTLGKWGIMCCHHDSHAYCGPSLGLGKPARADILEGDVWGALKSQHYAVGE